MQAIQHIPSLVIAFLVTFAPAQAGEIKALASGATKDAIEEVAPTFERASGDTLRIEWAGSVDIRKRINSGEVFDLIIASGPDIDAFIKDGRAVPGSRVDLMKSGMGVAVKAGAPKPDIKTPDAVKAALLAASSIGYSSGPSGTYLEAMLKRMSIFDQVKERMKQAPPGVAVGKLLVDSQADLGVQQISEMVHYPGIVYLGPLPPEIQNITVFSAGLHSKAENAKSAKDFVSFLGSPEAHEAIRRQGMEPG